MRAYNIWSMKSDNVGREILYRYLYGNGEDFPAEAKHANYLKDNKLLQKQIQQELFAIANRMNPGESINIDMSMSAVIENGEDIIGYQYLYGTNADVGGFHIQGTITKLDNGGCKFDMTYTWNDIIDPNPQYASDQIKAKVAKWIPFANPSDYKIAISWRDISMGHAKGASCLRPGYGWLFS